MYLFLEPRQEGGGHGGQSGEGLAELDGSLHQVSEEGHRDAVHVGHGRAVQLDAPEKISMWSFIDGLPSTMQRVPDGDGPWVTHCMRMCMRATRKTPMPWLR